MLSRNLTCPSQADKTLAEFILFSSTGTVKRYFTPKFIFDPSIAIVRPLSSIFSVAVSFPFSSQSDANSLHKVHDRGPF